VLHRSRSRARFINNTAPLQYDAARDAAIAAARSNNAALCFAGAPSDLAGFVYQNSTGATAATGTDPIGLMLDRQYGTSNLGAEIVPSGTLDFSTAAWTKSGGATITGTQVINLPTAGTSLVLIASSGVNTAGKTYRASATMSGTGTVTLSVTNFVDQRVDYQVTLTGSPTTYFFSPTMNGTATTQGSVSIFRNTGDTATSVTVSAISFKQVLGYPALQATAANKPTLLLNAAGYYDTSFDVTNDTWSVALPSSGAPAVVSYTDTGAITGYVSATTSGFVIGTPTIGGKKLSLLVASASALPAGDLDIIKAFAGVIRGSAF
jgi:hypothetical protein